jgi:hypothetical protein
MTDAKFLQRTAAFFLLPPTAQIITEDIPISSFATTKELDLCTLYLTTLSNTNPVHQFRHTDSTYSTL